MARDAAQIRLAHDRSVAGCSDRHAGPDEDASANLGARAEDRRPCAPAYRILLDWATISGYRQGDNPARWSGHLEHLLAPPTKLRRVEHHAALAVADVPAFMVALRKVEGTTARAIEFTILTAARRGEVLGARWDEIDLDGKVWIVPGTRMKSGKEHRVPVSPRAIAILKGQRAIQRNDLVFPGKNDRMLWGDGVARFEIAQVRRHAARLPIFIPRLVRGIDLLSAGGRGSGVGAQRRRCGRASIPAR